MFLAEIEKSLEGKLLFNCNFINTFILSGKKSTYYSFLGECILDGENGNIYIQTENPYNIDGSIKGCSLKFITSEKRIVLNDKLSIKDYKFLQLHILKYIYENNIRELKPRFEYYNGRREFDGVNYTINGGESEIFCMIGDNTELFYCMEKDVNGNQISSFSNEYELTGRGQALELLVTSFIIEKENVMDKMKKYIDTQIQCAKKNHFIQNIACIVN